MAQRIYIASDQLLVNHLCNLLEQAGIPALMQKSVVDAPQEECTPLAWYSELWILRDRQLASASQLLRQALASEGACEYSGPDHRVASTSPSLSPPAEIA